MTLVEFRPHPNCTKRIGPLVYAESDADCLQGDLFDPGKRCYCSEVLVNGVFPDDADHEVVFLCPNDDHGALETNAYRIGMVWFCGLAECDFWKEPDMPADAPHLRGQTQD